MNVNLRNLKIRANIIRAIREFFYKHQYLEVETPIRCPSVIPEAHIEPVSSEDFFLQASPELCMKGLLARGAEKIFQICKCFRRDERGKFHLPELSMLEWYAKDQSYLDLMNQCEALVKFIANSLNMGNFFVYQGINIHLSEPGEPDEPDKLGVLESSWHKITVKEAFSKFASISAEEALQKNQFEEIMSFQIEPHMIQPCFLYNYPSGLASLAELVPSNPEMAQRMEFYIAGIELANGFTELTDPDEQRKRFHQENMIRAKPTVMIISTWPSRLSLINCIAR